MCILKEGGYSNVVKQKRSSHSLLSWQIGTAIVFFAVTSCYNVFCFSLSPDVGYVIFSPSEDSSSQNHNNTYLFHIHWRGSLSFGYAGGLPRGSISRLLVTVFTLVLTHMGDATFLVLVSPSHAG